MLKNAAKNWGNRNQILQNQTILHAFCALVAPFPRKFT